MRALIEATLSAPHHAAPDEEGLCELFGGSQSDEEDGDDISEGCDDTPTVSTPASDEGDAAHTVQTLLARVASPACKLCLAASERILLAWTNDIASPGAYKTPSIDMLRCQRKADMPAPSFTATLGEHAV